MVFLFGCLALAGVYLIVESFVMKKTGKIPYLLLNNKINLENAKDKPGFIKYMFPRCIVGAVIMIVFSVLEIVCEYRPLPDTVVLLNYLVYIITIVYFLKSSLKAQRIYLFNVGRQSLADKLSVEPHDDNK